MITEQGTIKVSTKIDANAQKELNGKTTVLCIVLIVAACVLMAIYIVDAVLEFSKSFIMDIVVLVFAAFILVCAIIGLAGVKRMQKQFDNIDKVCEYEFNKSFFLVSEITKGEITAKRKVYNSEIIKYYETKTFIFLYLNNRTAYPIGKADVNDAELKILRNLFSAANRNSVSASDNFLPSDVLSDNVTAADEPQDPFIDFDK